MMTQVRVQDDVGDGGDIEKDKSYFYHIMDSISLKESFSDISSIDVVKEKDEFVMARLVKKAAGIEEAHILSF